MDSILTSVKKMLGITEEYTHFDSDIIMHINSVFSILTQIGIGPVNGFCISDASSTWDDFMPHNPEIDSIKSYMFLKVKMLFDPPTSGAVMDSMNRTINEFEWRLNFTAEHGHEHDSETIVDNKAFIIDWGG